MKISEIVKLLEAEMLCGQDDLDREIKCACGADLMSDVLAFVKHDALLLTGLVNAHVVRTAEMMDITLIVFVRGKYPGEDVIEVAKEKGIALMTTKYTMFTACGVLYENGLTGSAATGAAE